MQNSCLECYCKHIGTANAFENEYNLGYPLYKWLVVGEICAAEHEVVKLYPELAQTTREYRKKFMEENISFPTLELLEIAETLKNNNIENKSNDK